MTDEERDPKTMIAKGHLEKCEDFDHNGSRVLASRLGYRITQQFVIHFFGRVFNHPHVVLTNEMLKPELQDLTIFADGISNIVSTQKRVAQHYFNDGTVEYACPPLKALLHIMVHGQYEGKNLQSPEIRGIFSRSALLKSEWYEARLAARQRIDTVLWERHVAYLENYLRTASHVNDDFIITIEDRLMEARNELKRIRSSDEYRKHLHGTIGAEPALNAN